MVRYITILHLLLRGPLSLPHQCSTCCSHSESPPSRGAHTHTGSRRYHALPSDARHGRWSAFSPLRRAQVHCVRVGKHGFASCHSGRGKGKRCRGGWQEYALQLSDTRGPVVERLPRGDQRGHVRVLTYLLRLERRRPCVQIVICLRCGGSPTACGPLREDSTKILRLARDVLGKLKSSSAQS